MEGPFRMANESGATAEKLGWWDSIRVYGERRTFVMLLLGFRPACRTC